MTNIPAQGATSLRERLIDDMNVRRLCRATQRNYVRDVARFAGWLGRPPGFGEADVRFGRLRHLLR